MIEIFEKLLELINQNQESVLVTVIESTGSTPREKGARMLVAKEGRICGTIGGGTVEYLAEEQGKISLEEKRTCVKDYNLSPNEVADLGMICGGQVKVLFQYLNPKQPDLAKTCTTIIDYINTNQHFWLMLLLDELPLSEELPLNKGFSQLNEQRQTPMLLLHESGIWTGSDISYLVAEDNDRDESLSTRPTEIVSLSNYIPKRINGLESGFSVVEFPTQGQYFVEKFSQKGKVFIFGGGHVSQALVPVLRELDFYCVVLEDREDFLTEERFPTANERILMDFNAIDKKVTVTEKDYAVVITRNHQFDYKIQKQLLNTPIYYIGVMGSKSKTATQKNMLEEEGYTIEQISRLNMPIGTKIKAETVKELAISIAGELILKRAIVGISERGK